MKSFMRQWVGWLAASLLLVTTPLAAQNIALNKPATATSSQGGFPPKQVNDNDANTRWGSEYDTSLTTILPDSNSIYIDLQGMGTITQVSLNWETALGQDFKIEVSNDAKTWTGILKVTGNSSRTNTLAVSGQGRYVRMHGLKRGTQFGYSLWEFQVMGTLAPLPVSLVAFSATQQNAAVALRWTTATELNNTGFEVQRSADGVAFTSLAFVAGAGNSQLLRTYSYLDAQPLGTTSYYRLKQLDVDGKVAYSTVQTVRGGLVQVASVFPNPATTQATVVWSAASPGFGRWSLATTTGQVVHTETLAEQNGSNQLVLDLTPYPVGSYILTVEAPGQVQYHTRLQKVN
ncbi:MAG: discoidin domain-containing protein [Janthinobacterium lividum]